MHIELVDALRCTRPHEDTWLVGAFDRMDGRHVAEGRLACPLCRAEFPIRNGIAWFDAPEDGGAPPAGAAGGDLEDPERATLLAALLALAEPGGTAVLAGGWAAQAEALGALVETRLLLVNPPAGTFSSGGDDPTSVLRTRDRLPLGPASVRGVALDETTGGAGFLESAVRALRAGGRLVAPAAVPVPAGVTELARDETLWVAERAVAESPPVRLGIARRG